GEIARLLALVEQAAEGAQQAAQRLVDLGEEAARALVAKLPGPLQFGHRKLNTVGLPLAEHGPLLGLAGRFGHRIVAPAAAPLGDPSSDVRFHAALVVAEARAELAVE